MIRKATIDDIKKIYNILKIFGNKGELLPRALSDLYDHVRDFWVMCDTSKNDEIIACCALQFCWEFIAEIRSLAVKEEYQKKNIGTKLVNQAIFEAQSFNIKKIFTLTYQSNFFKKFGFNEIDKKDLPIKIWNDCVGCVKFPNCDEIAMMLNI